MSTETKFGAFFRTTRKALGLNLREFCRRNGFDPGNISRLERGISPPPQSQEALEAFAKALKLKAGTERRERFFELAAAATGRIPAELLEGHKAATQLPGLFRQLRGGQGHRNWVTARHLEQWADTLPARGMLPQLVRRLVHATGNGVTIREFPAGEQGQRPDWDGVVEATGMDEFVPEGVSHWEMGVTDPPGEKAEQDFEKRTKRTRASERKQTTFVFVTPRKWQKKSEWAKAKKRLRKWKDVRVYDSASLEEWLERAPAVDVWLAQVLGIKHEGAADIDEYWTNLAEMTVPSFTPEVFLASRAKEAERFKEWLAGPPDALAIETRSPAEAVDFVAAFSRSPAAGEAFTARAVVVESREAWRAMAASGSNLILIAAPVLALEPELVAEAVRLGQHVILSSERVGERVSKLQLPRVYRYDLQKALVSSGFEPGKAGDYADKAGGSLTVLKRLLGRYPGTIQPAWSRQPDAASLVPFLLAGNWEETSEEDRLVLEQLSKTPYHEIAAVAERWLHDTDPPVTRVLSRWDLVSRDDSWFLLAYAVTQDHLRRFEKVAMDVLGEDDPAYELAPDERWMASLHGKVLRHSQTLRTGLSETLALIGGRPERVQNCPGLPGMVAQIVRKLLHGKDWKRWASLSRQLPLLAEAAPDAFLEAVERDLKRSDSALVKLFEQEGDPVLSSSPHTGLLWGLEGLAWDRSWLRQVAYLLARLDELAPPGLRYRPLQSLQRIFLPQFPQTTVPAKERVEVLSAIAKKRSAVAWCLLVSLLPERFGFAIPISRPAFRDWALSWSAGAPNADYRFQVTATADLLVDLLGNDLGRWKELIGHVESLPGPARSKFLERLASFDVMILDYDSRRAISEALREKVARHRRFAQAGWALPEDILVDLEQAQQRFQPDDVVARHAWLFDKIGRVIDWQVEKAEETAERRRSALRKIENEAGWNGILALAEMVKAPEEAGWVLGEIGSAEIDSRVVPDLLTGAGEKVARLAQGYTQSRLRQAGWAWAEALDTSSWSIAQVGEFALRFPFERRAWEFVCGKGASVEDYYWSKVPGFYESGNPEDVAFAVRMFLKHNQPFQAFHVLAMALHQKTPMEPTLIMDALEAGLSVAGDNKNRETRDSVRYTIPELFQALQQMDSENDPRVDVQRLASLEWQYLGFLDGHPTSPLTLYRILQSDPGHFVELLTVIFRERSKRGEPKPEPSEQEQAKGLNAYRLLMSWDQVPGSREDGTVDGDKLQAWIAKARQLAEEKDRLEICESKIGEVLARHNRGEEDGSWPCIPIRDTLEEIGTEDVFNGFEIGIFNKRGTSVRSPTEGGKQERDLAKKFQAWADASKIDWPKTAASLRRVAEDYEEQARREDVEVLLDR